MAFVNQIAEIVHGVVDEYHGAPNKNSGDSFMVIWRCDWVLTPEQAQQSSQTQEEKQLALRKTSHYAEMAIVAFVKIMAGVHSSQVLAEYRDHPGLQQRIHKYRVELGFGLHYGWAIEGAIGSEFKIDASYLSPNVNIATQLESFTRYFGSYFLMSESVIDLVSKGMAQKCRLIDRLQIPGSKVPMRVYSLDLNPHNLAVEVPLNDGEHVVWTKRQRFKVRQVLESQKLEKLSCSITQVFEDCEDVQTMRLRYSERFFQIYGMGYHNYIAGEWKVASKLFTESRSMLGVYEDGPSMALLNFMHESDYTAPPGWLGYRALNTTKTRERGGSIQVI